MDDDGEPLSPDKNPLVILMNTIDRMERRQKEMKQVLGLDRPPMQEQLLARWWRRLRGKN